MTETLKNIDEIIEKYESGAYLTLESLRDLLRALTTSMYFLTKDNIEAHERHNAIQYKHNGSVAGGLIFANEQVPELRQLRKILEAANNVKSSMIMELSILKNET